MFVRRRNTRVKSENIFSVLHDKKSERLQEGSMV